jgi:hypothetical protein
MPDKKDGEKCACGQNHVALPASVTTMIDKGRRRFQLMRGGWYASIAVGIFAAGLVQGWEGSVLAAAVFAIYFFKQAMRVAVQKLQLDAQELIRTLMATDAAFQKTAACLTGEANEATKKDAESGQYL